MTKEQTMIYKTLHRKPKDWATQTPQSAGMISGFSEGYPFLTPLVVPFLLFGEKRP